MPDFDRTPMTEQQFQEIEQLGGFTQWGIQDVPRQLWDRIPNRPRPEDTFAIMISGAMSDPRCLNGIQALVGMDVLTVEPRPQVENNEPEGNAYHVLIMKTNHQTYPYLLCGPFTTQTIVPHWFSVEDLERYWPNNPVS